MAPFGFVLVPFRRKNDPRNHTKPNEQNRFVCFRGSFYQRATSEPPSIRMDTTNLSRHEALSPIPL